MGEEIPLESRILGAADALDAMISERPYRQGMPLDEAMAELARAPAASSIPRW